MPDPVTAPDAKGQQSKDAVNYRQGGDVCHVCIHAQIAMGGEDGTCSQVAGPINGHDVCDLFKRKGEAAEEGEAAGATSPEAQALARRGMISDKAMLGLRGRDY